MKKSRALRNQRPQFVEESEFWPPGTGEQRYDEGIEAYGAGGR